MWGWGPFPLFQNAHKSVHDNVQGNDHKVDVLHVNPQQRLLKRLTRVAMVSESKNVHEKAWLWFICSSFLLFVGLP